jgi:hypothetical protein
LRQRESGQVSEEIGGEAWFATETFFSQQNLKQRVEERKWVCVERVQLYLQLSL